MVSINPPPLEIPPALASDKRTRGFLELLLRTLYQIWNKVFSLEFEEKTTTTNATPTVLQRVTVETNKTVHVQARVVARRTGGSSGTAGDSAFYILWGVFKDISGTVSLVGASILNGAEDQAGWDLAFSISGSQVLVVGTGAANNNITWKSFVSFYEVGV